MLQELPVAVAQVKVDPIVMNSENSKTSDPPRLLLNL